jgi:hypothetical protein
MTRAQVRALSTIVVLLGVSVVANLGCGAGSAARPTAMTAWQATGDQESQCRIVADRGEPLVVDWPAHQRANMEEAMSDGIAIVAYDCHSLRLLKGCRLDSTYGFMSFSKKEQTVRFDNADEVAANLPAFGTALLKGLHGDLKSDSTLDLAMILVGKKRSTVKEAKAEELLGGAACSGATHFVRGAFVGAFAMGTGTRGEASLGAGLFAANSKSAELATYRDGDPSSCQQIAAGASSAPDSCDALVRLELVALGSTPAKEQAAAASDVPTCPQGLVLRDGKCALPTTAAPHTCAPRDVADCTEQCTKGQANSCTNLGSLYESGTGVPQDKSRAAALYKQGCDGNDGAACLDLAYFYVRGIGGLGVEKLHAVTLEKRACDLGYESGCTRLARAYMTGEEGVPKDYSAALGLWSQGCNGGDPVACSGLGVMYEGGRGTATDGARAFALSKRGCDGGWVASCNHLGLMFEQGIGVPANRTAAVAQFRKTCPPVAGDDFPASAGRQMACDNLKRLGESP